MKSREKEIVSMMLTIFSLSVGQTHDKPIRERSDEQAIRHVEDEITAALDHNDANTLDRLWASDYSFINPGGVVMTKAQRLAALRTGDLKLESYSRDEETIRTYGTAAVVTYRSTVIGHKTCVDIGSKRRVTTVLVKKNGRWQVVAQQSTRIAQR